MNSFVVLHQVEHNLKSFIITVFAATAEGIRDAYNHAKEGYRCRLIAFKNTERPTNALELKNLCQDRLIANQYEEIRR